MTVLRDDAAQVDALQAELRQRAEQELAMAREIGELRAKLTDTCSRLAETDPLRVQALEQTVEVLRRRVLIVDDEKPLLRMYEEVLIGTGLLRVDTAPGVFEAIEIMNRAVVPPDLILLDIKMPFVSGTKFCAALERNPRLQRIPVIFCSAHVGDQVRADLEKLHPVAFIRKPAELSVIESTVLSALGLHPVHA